MYVTAIFTHLVSKLHKKISDVHLR